MPLTAKHFPKTGFIADYMDYCSNVETAKAYDFWGALWLISCVVGRNLVIARPQAPVYMNWYIIFVAESGTTRKSTAVRIATGLLKDVADELPHYFNIIEGKTTPEQLEETLAKQSKEYNSANCFISVSELVSFMGKERYTVAMPGLLTDLYDSPAERKSAGSLTRGATTLNNVYVTLLSASTATWLTQAINPTVIEGGFTSRVIFVSAESPKGHFPWPIAHEDEHAKRGALTHQLVTMAHRASVEQKIHLSSAAIRAFGLWYKRREHSRDAYSSSFESRQDAHTLRLAATLSVAENSWEVSEKNINQAIAIIEEMKQDAKQLFMARVGSGDNLNIVGRVSDLLLKHGTTGINGTQLSLGVSKYMDRFTLDTLMRIMHEMGLVQKFVIKSEGVGRPKTLWRATKLLLTPNINDVVANKLEEQ